MALSVVSVQLLLALMSVAQLLGRGEAMTISGCHGQNNCNGHGTCDDNKRRCTCMEGWGADTDIALYKAPDCSRRTCPSGYSWFTAPKTTTMAHEVRECSDGGICDRNTGKCRCFDGFDGTACQRMGCKDKCSGHGNCVSMRRAAKMTNAFPLSPATSYEGREQSTTWDSDQMHGCICESSWAVGLGSGERQLAEWYGPACSLRRCPSGNDPLSVSNDENCYNKRENGAKTAEDDREIQEITTSSTTGPLGGTYSLSMGSTGTTTTTAITPNADFSAENMQSALQSLDAISNVEVQRSSFRDNGYTYTVTFAISTGDVDLITANTSSLTGGSVAVREVRKGVAGHYGQPGNRCHIECSGRGSCDPTFGVCTCFSGYRGSACEIQDAQYKQPV